MKSPQTQGSMPWLLVVMGNVKERSGMSFGLTSSVKAACCSGGGRKNGPAGWVQVPSPSSKGWDPEHTLTFIDHTSVMVNLNCQLDGRWISGHASEELV